MTTTQTTEAFVLERVAEISTALASVVAGEHHARLDPSKLRSDSPFHTLYEGINEMLESLERTRRRTEQYSSELEARLMEIDAQRAAIDELSTPIVEVWDRVVCLPVVGVVDSARSASMTEALLEAVVKKRARCAIIDVTAIDVIDTAVADAFLRMAKSVRLLGSTCYLSGVRPSVAQTLVHMDVDLGEVKAFRDLRSALFAFSRTGELD